jgi:hypothetical protein
MKYIPFLLLFLVLAAGCSKPTLQCNFPTFLCLKGNWIEQKNTDSSVKEYIQVYLDSNDHEIFYDWTAAAQLHDGPEPLGEYYFSELPDEDSVSLSPVWNPQTCHWYLKMISANEIEIDYGLPPGPPSFKKRYIRE